MYKLVIVAVVIALVVFYFQSSNQSKKLSLENKQKGAEFLGANALKDDVITTSSGLQYLVLSKGTGTEHPTASNKVKVHYHGTLTDGTVFDSSVDRGQPLEFGLGQVIKGWTEGLQLMVVGEKARLFIPSDLAYGNKSAGAIKPGSTLIFDVELLEIN
ncbi:MAG: FKBP-type peptidyl-prolyl cis-trans isomerase [Pseudomonadales bacterium]